MKTDFGKIATATATVAVNDQGVELLQQYKYLSAVIDKLAFELQVDAVFNKGPSAYACLP